MILIGDHDACGRSDFWTNGSHLTAHSASCFTAVLLLWVTLVAGVGSGVAGEPDWPRWYGELRLGEAVLLDTTPARGIGMSRMQQATAFTLGAEVRAGFSIEVAGDAFETGLENGGRSIGEYGIFALVTQARLSFPIARLTPYVTGGAGLAFTEFNDRKPPGFGRRIEADDTAPAGTIGAGIHYAISEDVALGIDARYLFSPGHEVTIDGVRRRVDVQALLATGSLRLQAPAGMAGQPTDVTTIGRYYLAFRLGGSTLLRSQIAPGLVAEPENAAIAGTLNAAFGVAIGRDITPFLGVEIAGDGYEPILSARGVGSIAEYAIYTVVPQLRVRYPLLRGHLVPYAVVGVGVSWAEVNDKKPRSVQVDPHGSDYGIVGVLGAGGEYFLTRNIAVGLETKYQAVRGHEIEVAGRNRNVRVDAFLTSAALRVYLGAR